MSDSRSSTAEEKARSAERELRHGNFRGALTLFRELATSDPGNQSYQARIATLEEGLQPMELHHPKAAAGAAASPLQSDLQRGEAAANEGDLATAVACYARVVAAAPENELAADRLGELEALLTAAPPPAAASPKPDATEASRTAPGHETIFDPIDLLETLLSRIQARRQGV